MYLCRDNGTNYKLHNDCKFRSMLLARNFQISHEYSRRNEGYSVIFT